MATLEDALNVLDPPVKHEIRRVGESVSLLLIDPDIPAVAQRSLSVHELENLGKLRLIVLYAVNELRAKGSHAELTVLPEWDESI